MDEAGIYVRNFLNECHNICELWRTRPQLEKLVNECKRAADAGDENLARSLLDQADIVRAKIDQLTSSKIA